MNFKIYYQDIGVYGSIFVIAENETAARELMQDELNYDKNRTVSEYEITNGLILSNYGDK